VLETLVERAKNGDEEAYAGLIAAVGDRLLAIAYRILRDTSLAEEAVQISLISAWRDLASLRDTARFEAWITRLVVRACYAEARRQRLWNAHVRELAVEGPEDPGSAMSVVDRDELDRGFRRLTPEQRAIFILHHYVGWTQVEIARNLEIPIGTVKSRLHYATQTLRAALEADARTVTAPEWIA
jgi:RNA polymerase sigma-70 factor (ECF subfamily)